MTNEQERAFRRWLSNNNYDPLPYNRKGIAFRKNGSEEVHWIFPLARGGVNGTMHGYAAYQEFIESGYKNTMGPPEYSIHIPRVSQDVAVELFLHHYQLMMAYLQVTPEDGGDQILEEANRVIKNDSTSLIILRELVESVERQYSRDEEQ